MSLRQIDLLPAVVRCETSVGAGREFGFSQQAVGNATKHLETELGFPLLPESQ